MNLTLAKFAGCSLLVLVMAGAGQAGGLDYHVVGEVKTAPGHAPHTTALALEGGPGHGVVDLPADYSFSHGLTLEAWISPDKLIAGRIIDRSTPGQSDSFCLDTFPGDGIRFITPLTTISAAHVLKVGEWFHVVALYDAEAGFLGIFVNGKLAAQAAVAAQVTIGGTHPIAIGSDPMGGNGFWGKIDAVRIYDYALSDADVAARFAGREVSPPTAAAPVAAPICYRGGAQVDMRALLAHNDVVYLSPAIYAHEAMPVGNGRLCAVVWNGPGLEMQLNNADNIWYETASGAVRLSAPGLLEKPESFSQRQSLYDGRILTTCKSAAGAWQATTTVLDGLPVVAVHLEGKLAQPTLTLQLEQWRPTAKPVTGEGGGGFVEDLPVTEEPQFSRKLALLARADCLTTVAPAEKQGDSQVVTLTLSPRVGADGKFACTIYLANPVVKADADPQAAARAALQAALQLGWTAAAAQEAARWHKYWDRSFLYLASPDGLADYQANLWYLDLYWMGCGGEGDLAVKFNGGPFLMHRDLRSWGQDYWYQNTRELYWPLPAANHLDLCRGFQNLYLSNLPAHRKLAQDLFHQPGLQVEETMRIDGVGDKYGNPYTMLYLSTGLEVALQLYHEATFAHDDSALREKVLPFMKEAMDFFLAYATKGPDGVYHIVPCDARETYWRVEDGMNEVAAIREALPVLRSECKRLGLFPEMQAKWQEFEEHFAPLPERPGQKVYAPCIIPPEVPPSDNALVNKLYPLSNTSTNFDKRFNGENVELDFIYPFGLAGIGSANLEEAIATYKNRVFTGSGGWDWTPICAARLGLGDEAARKLAEHTRNSEHWPQGWWDSPANPYFAGGLVDCPYFDSAGVNATTTTEMVLQSYNGIIRVWPAVPAAWSGAYKLRAETGFLVTTERSAGVTQYVELESLFGNPCRLANPWTEAARVTCDGREVLRSAEQELSFPTQKGKKYLVERVAAPVAKLSFARLQPAPNEDVKYMRHSRRGQGQQTPQPGEPCLGITADGLNPPRVAQAQNYAAAQAAIQQAVGDAPKIVGVQVSVMNEAGQLSPAPWTTDGIYGPDNIAQRTDAVGYVLELPAPQQIKSVVWSFDRAGGRMDINDYLAGYHGWPALVTLESSTDGQTWQQVGETKANPGTIFGQPVTPAQPLKAKWLRLRFWAAPDKVSAMPCDEIEVY